LRQGVDGKQRVFDSFEDKSSGWTERWRNLSKKALVDAHGDELTLIVYQRLMLRFIYRSKIPTMTSGELFEVGLCDPKDLFIKDEPHDSKKRATERWRLIWNTSTVDAAVQSLLHGGQNKRDIKDYQDEELVRPPNNGLFIPGIGVGHHDEGIARTGKLIDEVFPGPGLVSSADASGWDLSVTRLDLVSDCARRVVNLDRQDDACLINLMFAEAFVTSAHTVSFGEDLYQLDKYGITASGTPSTSGQNTFIRLLKARVAGATSAIAVGDDLLFRGLLDDHLHRLFGVVTKEGSLKETAKTDGIEFLSHEYRKSSAGWSAKFLNVAKSTARLSFIEPSPDNIGGVLFALRHSPESRSVFTKACDVMGWNWSAADSSQFLRPDVNQD
jgi:hypothetical protein